MSFVTAYDTTTGRKHRVPKHWIGHPVLGRGLDLAPSERGAESAPETGTQEPVSGDAPALDESTPLEELIEHSIAHQIDLSEVDITDAGEVLAAIQIHHESPSGGEEE